MMDCLELVKSYPDWLYKEITLNQLSNGICEITTPFLDRHNDCLQIYLKKKNGRFILTDDGYIISDLGISGWDFKSSRRKRLLNIILKGFGVKLDESQALFVEADRQNFAQKKHNLIQAMLAVNDLVTTHKTTVRKIMAEDVEEFFLKKGIRFTSRINFTGKSTLTHLFDLVISHSKSMPERIVRAINQPNKNSVVSMLFAWEDIRESRWEILSKHRSKSIVKDQLSLSRAYFIWNDKFELKSEFEYALTLQKITPLGWSKREKFISEFAG